MKYIMIQRELPNTDGQVTIFPVIFPNVLVHLDIANAILDILRKDWPDSHSEIISAGEVSIQCRGTGGISDTLKLMTGVHDQKIINYADYMHVWERQDITHLKTDKTEK